MLRLSVPPPLWQGHHSGIVMLESGSGRAYPQHLLYSFQGLASTALV